MNVIFISHNPHHAFVVGDRFIILKRGKVVGTWKRDEISREALINGMAGADELDELRNDISQFNQPFPTTSTSRVIGV